MAKNGAAEMRCSTINLRVLAACALFASKEESRYYLNGVCLEIDARGVTYVGTDGGRLLAYRDELDDEADENLLTGTFIIPSIHCKHFAIGKEDEGRAKMFGDGRLTIAHDFVDVTFMPIDGVYPDWRKSIPDAAPSGDIAQFQLGYLTDLHKFSKALDLGTPFIAHNGVAAPALIWFPCRPHILGVMMPIKMTDELHHAVPPWAQQGPAHEQADLEDVEIDLPTAQDVKGILSTDDTDVRPRFLQPEPGAA